MKSKLHEQVATKIAAQIKDGTLPSGKKVPSLRHVSHRFGVSVPTVTQAYWFLENEGLLECRPQSGFYVRQGLPLPPLEPPPVDEPSRISSESSRGRVSDIHAEIERKLMFSNSPVLLLGITVLDPSLLPMAALRLAFSAGPRRLGPMGFGVNWPPGNETLRRQVARHYLDSGLSLSPNDFMTTNGCTEAIQLALRAVTKPGDIVAVESPASAWSLVLLETLKLRTVEIPMHPQTGMDLDVLEKALQRHPVKACLTVTQFSDPIGCLMPEENKKRLVELLSQRDIPLIEDDVFGELYFGEQRPKPAKAFDTKGLVMLCSSFSKTVASGLRVGWITPGRFYSEVKAQKAAANLACDAFMESALGLFMEKGSYKKHLRKMRKFFAANLGDFNQALARHLPKGTKISRPHGGLGLWLELPEKVDAIQLCLEALDQKIFLSPGPAFSMQGNFKNNVRICFSLPFSPMIDQALEKVGALVKRQLAGKK